MTGLHFLCRFYKRKDATGKLYFAARLGNSRLLLFPDGDELTFYLGAQIETENLSLQDALRATNSRRGCTDDQGKLR